MFYDKRNKFFKFQNKKPLWLGLNLGRPLVLLWGLSTGICCSLDLCPFDEKRRALCSMGLTPDV